MGFKLVLILILYIIATCSSENWRYRSGSALKALYRLRGGINTNHTIIEDDGSSNVPSYLSVIHMNDKKNNFNQDNEDEDYGDLQINVDIESNPDDSDTIIVDDNNNNEAHFEKEPSSPKQSPTQSHYQSNSRGGSMTDGDIFSLMDDLPPLPL